MTSLREGAVYETREDGIYRNGVKVDVAFEPRGGAREGPLWLALALMGGVTVTLLLLLWLSLHWRIILELFTRSLLVR